MYQGRSGILAIPRVRLLMVLASLVVIGTFAVVVLSTTGGSQEGQVVRWMATEMPKLDLGVQQVVHATFVGNRQPSLGQAADMRLVLTSAVPGLDVSARFDAPADGAITGGVASWNGEMDRMEVVEIPVSVKLIGDKGGFVRAEVVGRTADGREYRSATAAYVDPGEPDSPPPEAKTLIEPDGAKLDVVVYKPSER